MSWRKAGPGGAPAGPDRGGVASRLERCSRWIFVLLAGVLCSIPQAAAQHVSPSSGRNNAPRLTLEEIQRSLPPPPSPEERAARERQAELDAARRLYQSSPEDFVRAEPFIEGYAYLQVRLPASTRRYDAAIKFQARHRLGFHFAIERPQPLDITVVAGDFSSRADVQRRESTEFQRAIPRTRQATRPELRRLLQGEEGARPTVAQIQSALAAEGTDVVILVGHLDADTGTMTRTERGAVVRLDLRIWFEAAHRAGVVVVPLGCLSASCAPIGSPHLLNSRQIFDAVATTIASEPMSFAAMFGRLTSHAAMALTLDPFSANLGYERLNLTVDDRRIAEIWWSARLPSGDGPPDCGASRDIAAYLACAERAAPVEPALPEAPGENVAPPASLLSPPSASAEDRQPYGPIILFAVALFIASVPAAVAFELAGWKFDEADVGNEPEMVGYHPGDANYFRAYRDALGTFFLLHFAGMAATFGGVLWGSALGALGLLAVAAVAAALFWQGRHGGASWKPWLAAALAISGSAYLPLLATAWR